MTNQQILETLSNCIEIAKTTDNNYTVNKLTEVAEALKDDSIEHAKQVLKDNGYYTDNLWHVNDVLNYHYCTDNKAQEILNKALTNGWITEQINEQIKNEYNN